MIINPRVELAAAMRDIYRDAVKRSANKFKTGWKLSHRKQHLASVTAQTAKYETVAEFLARGGKITKVPYADVI